MLCTRAKDLQISYEVREANDETGQAHWEAHYTFSATGRTVHNIIEAEMTFRDGKIYRHRDRFDFWRWSRMALGPIGFVLGWTPMLRAKVGKQANAGLASFIKKRDS
jgi:hypothetical protein